MMFRKMTVVLLFGVMTLLVSGGCETVCWTVYPISGCNSGNGGSASGPVISSNSATANGQALQAGGTLQVAGDGNIQFDFSGIAGAARVEIIGPDGTHYIFDTLKFTWHPPSGGSFTIRVLNANGQVIISWPVTIQLVIIQVSPPPPPPPPPTGSCCSGNGSCAVTTQANCSGAWTQGGTCNPNPCSPPPPPPPPNIEPTIVFTDIQPAGGTYTRGATLPFRVSVSVSNGDGRLLNLRCLPYVGDAFNVAFAATNGSQTINLGVALTTVTNLGNNFFNVYDGGTAIGQWWTVSITVR